MDKNMVNIDDLFRQRLGDKEEQERPGAWLHMRDLLDEKMPESVGGGFNWRRMLGYATGLLLLASVSVGSYEMVSGTRERQQVATIDGTTTQSTIRDKATYVTKTTHKALAAASSPNITAGAAPNTQYAPAEKRSNSDNSITQETKNSYQAYTKNDHLKQNTHSSDNTNTLSGGIAANQRSSNNNPRKMVAASSHPINANKNAVTLAVGHSVAANSNSRQHTSGVTNKLAGSTIAIASATSGVNTPSSEKAKKTVANVKRSNNHSNTGRNTVLASGTNVAVATKVAIGKAQHTAANTITQPADTIQRMEIVQRYTRHGWAPADTLSVSRIPVMPARSMQPVANNNENIGAPIAAANRNKSGLMAATKNTAGVQPVAIPASKDASGMVAHTNTRKKESGFSLQHFDEMVNDAKSNIGSVRFSPGIAGGISGTFFGTHTTGGIQLGVTGNFNFSDHWNVLAELKYFNRFAKGVINDDYTTYQTVGGVQERDSMHHYFNYSSLQSLELPISVRYTTGHFVLFIGGSLIYDFAVNEEEIQLPYQVAMEGPVSKPVLSTNDFASRFGLGYLFGAGYQITPALQLDVRMTQAVWNNAKGNGAQIISNDFYKSPSAQISLSYMFNANKKK